MPYKKFALIGESLADKKAKDEKPAVERFKEFVEWIYGGKCLIDSKGEDEATVYMDVPGDMKRAEFDSDVSEWCGENGCSYELINQAPMAPSPQYFSENVKLMYPRAKDFEALSNPKRAGDLKIAKALWKKNWGTEFDPENPDDQEDIVLLYNEYMDELSEWKPVVLKLKWNQKEE